MDWSETISGLRVRISLFDELDDFFMVDQFATLGGGQPLSDFSEKPWIVIHQTLNGFFDKRFRPATLFGGKDGQFGLKVRTQI